MSTVLVTGAAVRIGATIAEHLACCGYDLVLHYHTSKETAESLANHIRKTYGRRVDCFSADLVNPEGADQLFDAIEQANIPLTAIINNASLFEPDDLTDFDRRMWDQHMGIHGWTPARLTQRFANFYHKQFPQTTGGNVIHLIDQRVRRLTPYFFTYTASKSLLWSMTQTMAMSLAPYIRVNGIAPGPTVANPRQCPEDFQKQAQGLPLKRSINPLEIAKTVIFLLESPSMTGNLLMVDGGQHLAWETPDVVGIQE